jgi:Xaa-Pro aminopeptidase
MNRTSNRIEKLRKSLKADRAERLLVASVTNVSYLTGFTGDDSTFLLTPTRALVISDGRYTTQLQQECPDLEIHIRPVGQPMNVGIAEVVGKLGIRRLAFEGRP